MSETTTNSDDGPVNLPTGPGPSTGVAIEQHHIAIGYRHVVAGMHIGPMAPIQPGRFDSVLTLAAQPGRVADSIHHRHLPLSYQVIERDKIEDAVSWTLQQVWTERTVLVRSEVGLQRPALVVGLAILGMGGRYADAISCLMCAAPLALTDFRYKNVLREEHHRMYPQ